MATAPSTATISGTALWSNTRPFDGWLRLGLVLATNSDGEWPSVVLEGQPAPVRLPIWIEVPIVAGVFNQQTKIWFNSSISPGTTQYVAYWYDRNNRRIYPATGVAPTPFTINTNPYAINVPTLTAPNASVTLPEPSEVPTRGV